MILILIIDGAPDRPIRGKTPLSVARKPNLDSIADLGINGIMDTIAPGIRPGSDTSHLAILGYDPYKFYCGRGPIEAAGIGIDVKPGDVAFRANFATVEGKGRIFDKKVVDRRAGRIENTDELIKALREIDLPVEFFIEKATGHRAAVVFRGEDLSAEVGDTDPKKTGEKVKRCEAFNYKAKKMAEIVNEFMEKAHDVLEKHPINVEREKKGLPKANALLLRGAGSMVKIPSFEERYGLKLSVISATALIKGVGVVVGAKVLTPKGATGNKFTDVKAKVDEALSEIKRSDVVLLHFKATDELGHDGDFEGKKEFIEKLDRELWKFLEKDFCLVVTSDHSTPVSVREHTADPVPIAIKFEGVRRDEVRVFSEFEAYKGGLCRIKGLDLINLLLDLTDLAEKFGA
ncbi:MAG: 2,3-bisphosphoglycerate-independent phosphoglycerate mutase [Archaeoglobaceae archaeon]|nr:2,3-bisphosphoglycerate-independent phosphoglycerate mutase [Archaeoglobaceae archaeon]MCX8152211.1 2,3-bisphosphoglycerate-independent phosphoglycerate mutase [Archaeoglobaceae archaeon]MDW8013997.1 2,3-bisphosphoglycerate-independent phosphoglycerate mutase [Archaeoglobaceae archaeon]